MLESLQERESECAKRRREGEKGPSGREGEAAQKQPSSERKLGKQREEKMPSSLPKKEEKERFPPLLTAAHTRSSSSEPIADSREREKRGLLRRLSTAKRGNGGGGDGDVSKAPAPRPRGDAAAAAFLHSLLLTS